MGQQKHVTHSYPLAMTSIAIQAMAIKIVSFQPPPKKKGDIVQSYIDVYQRVLWWGE